MASRSAIHEHPGRGSNRLAAAVMACLLVMGGGCGDSGPARVTAHGSVSLDGRPLENAVIMFIPVGPTGAKKTGAEIVHGQYRVVPELGVVVGVNRVEVAPYPAPSFSPSADVAASHGKRPPVLAEIPAKYNEQSELTVEAKPGVDNVFNFTLTTR